MKRSLVLACAFLASAALGRAADVQRPHGPMPAGALPPPSPPAPFGYSTTPTAGASAPLSPAAAAPPAATPSSTPSPSPSPMPAAPAATPTPVDWRPPLAPGPLTGAFELLTQAGKAGQPSLRLSWEAAEPGDYLVRAYHLERRESGQAAWQRRLGNQVLPDPEGLDEVELGKAYEYRALALDQRGAPSPPGPATLFDLRLLPEAILAPRPPEGLTAQSLRHVVKLGWAPPPAWIAPVSGYRVHRAESIAGLAAAAPQPATADGYSDTPPAQKKDYYYAVAAVDEAGRVSALSLTVSGQATGALAPSAPRALTARAKTEKVSLSWEAAQPGTAAVSAYVLQRREGSKESWEQVALMPATQTAYTDSVEGDRGYLYRLSAADAEGNTSEAAYAGASPSAKAYNKTLILLMPTAYAEGRGKDSGFNLNVMFDYYVGSLYESYSNPQVGIDKSGVFQALQVGTVTGDLKYALFDDHSWWPGLAAGFYGAALINFGQPTGAQSVGVSSAGGGIATLGNLYVALSKRFWPGDPRVALHVGAMRGKLADYLTSDPTPKDWRPTLRHLTPGGDVPALLMRLVDPKLGATVRTAPHLAFAGLTFPVDLPLGFTTWKTGLRLEALTPFAPDEEKVDFGTYQKSYAELMPWMFNFHIDNLPLFGFEFSIFQYQGGLQWIAFYHITDLTWSF